MSTKATLIDTLQSLTTMMAGRDNIPLAQAWETVLRDLSEAVESVEERLKEMGMVLPEPKTPQHAQTPKTPKSRLPLPKRLFSGSDSGKK